MNKKISVIIYNYNAGIYAGRLLKTLHKDEHEDLELVVVDDGSKDDSIEQIKHAVIENEIKNAHLYQVPKHRGKAEAYNLALTKITGDYVVFTCAEDGLDPKFILALSTTIMNEKTLALTGVIEDGRNRFCSLTIDRKENETLRNYLTRIKKRDARLASIFGKIFDATVIGEKDLKFVTSGNSYEQKFINDYLKAADIEKIVTIDKPLYTRNSK